MIKVAWIAVTCIYKVGISSSWYTSLSRVKPSGFIFFYQAAKAQQEVDEDSRQLVEDLSSQLAYTAACKDLPQINGGIPLWVE